MRHLELSLQPGQPPCQMRADGGGADLEQFGDLRMRPAVGVNHHHAGSLELRQRLESREQAGLERGELRRCRLREEPMRAPCAPGSGLPHSIQVAGRVVHPADPRPMLPPIGQCLSCCLTPDIRAIRSNEPGTQARTHRRSELLERHNQLKHRHGVHRDRHGNEDDASTTGSIAR